MRRRDDTARDETPDYNDVIGAEENNDNKALVYVKEVKNANGWLVNSISTT